MNVEEVLLRIESFAPLEKAESWDNVGLMAGDAQWSVTKIGVALDPSLSAVEEGVQKGCDLLVVHHPLIFSPLQKIDLKEPLCQAILWALENHLAIISLHTNWDKAPEGVNVQLGRVLFKDGFLPLVPEEKTWGLGAVGELIHPLCLRDLMASLRSLWNLSWVVGYGDENKPLCHGALCGGSGGDLWKEAMDKGAQVFITADMKYHQILDACSAGLSLCIVDHGEMERFSLASLAALLRTPEIVVFELEDKGPLRIVSE